MKQEAFCTKCRNKTGKEESSEMELDEEYRKQEGILSISEIEKLMKLYNIGKAPLSLALGFGEITVTRYLSGQMPSKEYSDRMRMALSSPTFMKELLIENQDKIAPAAFRKARKAAEDLEERFSLSEESLRVIAYLFHELQDLSFSELHHLLYFVNGLSLALHHKVLFSERCERRDCGPVFPKVQDLFCDFTFDPAEDARFAVLEGKESGLSYEEKMVTDFVVNTFGLYSGRGLDRIFKAEQAEILKMSDESFTDGVILPAEVEAYYRMKKNTYDFSTVSGIQQYINSILKA